MSTELALHQTNAALKKIGEEDDDEESVSDTFGSFSDYGRAETVMSRTLGADNLELMLTDDAIKDTLSGNPKNWHWAQIKIWLYRKNFPQFVAVFDVVDEDNLKKGIEGEELLDITVDKLFDESGDYIAGPKLGIKLEDAETHPLIERFFRFCFNCILYLFAVCIKYMLYMYHYREITKLELKSNEIQGEDPETTINDYIEMKRRINLFVDKWDKILWIEHYVDNNNGAKPSVEEVKNELELSNSVATVYLQYYDNMNRLKRKDLNELLLDFNVYEDAVIWWFLIISSLKAYPSKSMWLIFGKVAEITPGAVAIELLEKYRFDLTRFNAKRLDKVCQNIVIGSAYPVCASLRIAKWFNDRGIIMFIYTLIAHYSLLLFPTIFSCL